MPDILRKALQLYSGMTHFFTYKLMAKKLLVADDSLTIQKVIKLALSGDGYEIQTVSDGTECLQQAALFRPDVILIDVGLPGRSAFDIKKAANEDPDLARTPFILMSSAFEKVDEAKVALLRFDGRLTKPFDPSNLKAVLLDALKMNSGQGVREFSPPPPPAPSGNTSFLNKTNLLTPTSSKMLRPPGPSLAPASDNEVTGEIQLMDPSSITNHDPLWNDTPSNEPFSLDARRDTDDQDIRHLTESTVKMSGMDDLGSWNISEGSKNSGPSIPDIFSQGTQHDIPMPNPHLEFAPPPPITPSGNLGNFDLELGTTSILQRPPAPPSSAHDSPSSASLEALVEKQVREQLEILVQGAVKTQLEQMARKALPEIAERVVKAEIRKMLEGLSGS